MISTLAPFNFIYFLILFSIIDESFSFRCYHKEPLQQPVVIDCSAVGGEECLTCMCPVKNAPKKLYQIKECSKNSFTVEKLKRCKDCATCKTDLCNGDFPKKSSVSFSKFSKKFKIRSKKKSDFK